MSNEGIIILAVILFIITPIILLIKYPSLRRAIGFVLIIVGLLLSITGIGAIIGIPMLIIGALFYFVGQRNQSKIQNTRTSQQQTVNNYISSPAPQKTLIRCAECKTLNDDNALFCQKCGKELK